MKFENPIFKYERILIPILFVLVIILSTALAYIWKQALDTKSPSQPGDFLKIEKKFE